MEDTKQKATVDGITEVTETGEMIECAYCSRSTPAATARTVVGGEVVDRWEASGDVPAHVGVTGLNSPYPSVEKYCKSCYDEQFDTDSTLVDRVKQNARASPLLTASNLAAFLLGAGLMFLTFYVLFFV